MNLITALFLLSVQPEPKITLDLPISPLTSVLKEVSALAGQPHSVGGPGRDQWLFVQVKDLPAARLRDAVAKASGGRWVKSGDSWVLQTKDLTELQHQAYVSSITQWRNKQKSVPPFDLAAYEAAVKREQELSHSEFRGASGMDYESPMSSGPDRRLLQRILLTLPLSELTGLKSGESRVFSLEPTSLQRSLPGQAAAALADYRSEAEQASRKLEAISPPEGGVRRMTMLTFPYQAGMRVAEAARVLFELKRDEGGPGSLRVEVSLYNKEGSRVHSTSHYIAVQSAASVESSVLEAKAFQDLKGSFEPSDEEKAFSRDFISATGGSRPGEQKTPVSESTKQRLLNMDKVDLLSYGATDVMRAYAKEKGKQVVAKINDMAIYALAFITRGAQDLKGPPLAYAVAFSTGVYGSTSNEITEEPDLIVFPPVAAAGMPEFKLPRRGSLRLFKASYEGRDLLDPLADLSLECQNTSQMMMPTLLTSLLGKAAPMVSGEEAFQVLKLYGLLSTSERQAVKNGGFTLPLERLSPALKDRLLRLLIAGREGLNPLREGQTENDEPSGIPSYSYQMAPTVFLASPQAARGTLTISLAKTEGLLSSYGPGLQGARVASVEDAAWALYQREINSGFTMPEPVFAQGVMTNLTAQVVFPGFAFASRSFEIPSTLPGADFKSLKDLPADFREAVIKRLNELRSMYRDDGGRGGAVKPPQ